MYQFILIYVKPWLAKSLPFLLSFVLASASANDSTMPGYSAAPSAVEEVAIFNAGNSPQQKLTRVTAAEKNGVNPQPATENNAGLFSLLFFLMALLLIMRRKYLYLFR